MNLFFDIDNTICRVDAAHGAEKYARAVPIPERIARVNALYDEGKQITYWTARGKASGVDYTDLTRSQLAEWGCKYHALRFDKPAYDLYVDDKSCNSEAYFHDACCAESSAGASTTPAAAADSHVGVATRVPKGWGHELILTNTEKYCGKILHFNKDAKFSMHFHMLKTETWYVYSGKFEFRWIDTATADVHTKMLGVGDVVTNAVGQPHQLICLEEGDVFEVSTQHFDSDSYRVAKGDSQSADAITNLVLLFHEGIGDHVFLTPAVAHYAKLYTNVYIPCLKSRADSIGDLYKEYPNVTIIELSSFENGISESAYVQMIEDMNQCIRDISQRPGTLHVKASGDRFLGNRPHKSKYPTWMYDDLNLSMQPLWDSYKFRTTDVAKHLYNTINSFHIPYIFVHETYSGGKIFSADDLYEKSTKTREFVVLNPERNPYNPSDVFHYIARLVLRKENNLKLLDYKVLLENAKELHITDSSIFTLAVVLNISTEKNVLHQRYEKYRDPYPETITSKWITHYKESNLVLLFHEGIGDHVLLAPAVAHLSKNYTNIYIPCLKSYCDSVRYLHKEYSNVHILEIEDLMKTDDSETKYKKMLEDMKNCCSNISQLPGTTVVKAAGDRFLGNRPHETDYPCPFYEDLGLSKRECWEAYAFRTTDVAKELYERISSCKLPYIFVHETTSMGQLFSADSIYQQSVASRAFVVLNPDRNGYSESDPFYSIAQLAVRVPNKLELLDYKLLLENATEVYMTDSSMFVFTCMLNLSAVKNRVVFSRYGYPFTELAGGKWNVLYNGQQIVVATS